MNLLLVVRSEIIAAFILLFLIIYDRACAKYRKGKDYFLGFALAALGHVIMGLVTEITVNTENFPKALNDLFHILFFTFALLFSLRFFEYALSLITVRSRIKKYVIGAYVLSIASIIVMLLSKIEYLQGNGTKYSAGTGPTICYMLGFFLLASADVILVVNHKKLSYHIFYTLVPLSILGIGFMVVQIIVSEFLFTGCAITLIAVGSFFAIENPIGKFRDRAFVDQDTQVWNRNCYEYDVTEKIVPALENASDSFIFVMGDLNGLKTTNDRYGHLEGDRIIKAAADTLTENLRGAYRVYRIGGDEFGAVYFGKDKETVEEDILRVKESCIKYSSASKVPLSISLGYAERLPGEKLDEIVRRADENMYSVKDAYYIENGIEHRNN